MTIISDYLKILKDEFKGYNPKRFSGDLLSGITVAAVALPLALAFGVGSGASAAAGLVTAVIAGVVIGGLSGGSFQVSGPTGAMTAILVSIIAQHGLEGMFIACLVSGALLLLAAIFKLGNLVSLIPLPVITGFTSGIAVIIALGQVDNLTGLKSHGFETLERVASYFTAPQSPNLTALAIGLGVIILMALYPKKWAALCPPSLMAIILATSLNLIFDFPVARVGEIPRTLLLPQRLMLSDLSWGAVSALFAPAVSIAALGMIESLLCGACGGRMKGERLNAGVELAAQGIGNMLLPFFGGVPATAAIARTSVAIRSGCNTRMTSIIHAAVLLLSMFALGGIMSAIPLCALAGVLIMTAWRMNEWGMIREIFSKRFKSAILQFLITMAATVLFDLTVAIIIGVLAALFTFIVKVSDVKIMVSEIMPHKLKGKVQNADSLANTGVIYITGPLYFGSIGRLEDYLPHLKGKDRVIFSMRGVPLADISAVQGLSELCDRLKENGVEVYFASLQPAVEEMFDRCSLTESLGSDHFGWSTDSILMELAG